MRLELLLGLAQNDIETDQLPALQPKAEMAAKQNKKFMLKGYLGGVGPIRPNNSTARTLRLL